MLNIHSFLVAKFSVAACREGRMLRATFIEKKKQGKADMDRERPANKAPLVLATSVSPAVRDWLVAEVVVVVGIGTLQTTSRNLVIEAVFLSLPFLSSSALKRVNYISTDGFI